MAVGAPIKAPLKPRPRVRPGGGVAGGLAAIAALALEALERLLPDANDLVRQNLRDTCLSVPSDNLGIISVKKVVEQLSTRVSQYEVEIAEWIVRWNLEVTGSINLIPGRMLKEFADIRCEFLQDLSTILFRCANLPPNARGVSGARHVNRIDGGRRRVRSQARTLRSGC